MTASYNFTTLDPLPLGIVILDCRYNTIFWNQCIEQWTGIRREEILNTDIREWYPHFKTNLYAERLEEIFRGGAPAIFSAKLHQATIPCQSRDGTQRQQQTTVTAVQTERKNEYLAMLTIQDVSNEYRRMQNIRESNRRLTHEIQERKRVEETLRDAKAEADRANRSKSDFLSRMSHELRTPLNAILGFSQLLILHENSLNSRTQENLNYIIKAGNHLLDLINEILDLSQVETGQVQLLVEPVNLEEVVQDVTSLITPLADIKEVVFSTQTDNDAPLNLLGDRKRLKQVLINLASNAIKYNHPGGQACIYCKKSGSHQIQISVRDTGPGIPHDKLQNLFEPFERLGQESKEIEGTGIGLTITKSLVELMGGTITVKTRVGQGTDFTLTFNTADKPQSTKAQPATTFDN